MAAGDQSLEGIVNGTIAKQLRWRVARFQCGTRTRGIRCVIRISDGHCEKRGVRASAFLSHNEFPIRSEQTHKCIALYDGTHKIQGSTEGDR